MNSNNATGTTTGTVSTPVGNTSSSLVGAMAPILLMIVFFYFLIIRPQQKREAKRQSMINSVKRGDKVVTTSGVIGVIHKVVSDSELSLEIAENVRIRVLKNSIANVLDKKTELGKNIEDDEKKDTKKSKKKVDKNSTKSATTEASAEDDFRKVENS